MKYAILLISFILSGSVNAALLNYNFIVDESDSGLLVEEYNWSVGTDLEGFQFNIQDTNGDAFAIRGAEYSPGAGRTSISFALRYLGFDQTGQFGPVNYSADISMELFNGGTSVFSSLLQEDTTIAARYSAIYGEAPVSIIFDTIVVRFSPILLNAGEQVGLRTPDMTLYVNVQGKSVAVNAPTTIALVIAGLFTLLIRQRPLS